MADNQNILNTKSFISEDWNGGYKLEIDLTAKTKINDWKLDFNLPYKIRETYGVDLINHGQGSYSIDGKDHNQSLNAGQSTKAILIIDDYYQKAISPQLDLSEYNYTTPLGVNVNAGIVEDWHGGYKLEVDLTAQSKINNWKFDFNLPYKIKETYGVNLINKGNGNYSFEGKKYNQNLNAGQSTKAIFIVEDDFNSAVLPEFKLSKAVSTTQPTPTTNQTNSNLGSIIDQQDPVASSPAKGKFNYGEALQKNFLFLEANRSGDLGPDNRLKWRSDSTLNDGSTVGRDLEGGYFDAGDHVKFGQPMAASINMLAWGGIEYREAYQRSGQLDELLDAVKWGTDYFLKAHESSNGKTARLWVQVGEGKYDHKVWTSPENIESQTPRNAFAIDPNNPGSDVAASTSSALAAASMLFRGVDNTYADKLLENAKQLFKFAETYQGKYSDSVAAANPYYTSWGGYGDELASGAAWLYKATKDKSYLHKAENHFKNRIGGLGDWSWAVDDHSYGAAVILAQESDDAYFKGQVEGWLNKWLNGKENIKYTAGGFAHRAKWGSIPVTSSAAFLAQLYNDTVKQDSRYSNFANQQVDYILGDNPANLSYMIGFGNHYPQRPHHRGSSPNLGNNPTAVQENILYGAVVGGPNKPDDFAHHDRRDDWVTNEVGTSYNAPFASALIQQYDQFGGDALSESELDRLIGVDANGVGF